MPGAEIVTAELDEATVSPLEELVKQVGEGDRGPVMVVGLETSCPSAAPEQPVLRALNLSRPEWPERLPRPVVLWVPEYLLKLLAREAPDFLDWRSDTLYFAEPTVEELRPLDSRLWGGAARLSLPLEERLERLTELRSRLAGPVEDLDPVARAARQNWLLELADHLMLLGETGAAEDALREAEELLEGWESSESVQLYSAQLALYQGRLLAGRGEVQKAAEVFQNARAGFKALDKEREQAIATGALAQLKAQAGNIDEALRLHKEALSVYEHLGDVRSRAVTLGNLAQLKAQAGNIDEALRLHKERMEIFDRLGDVRERAVTLGDLARLKAQAGNIDEARAFNEERLGIVRRIGYSEGIANAQFDQAQLDLGEGSVKTAIPRLAEAWAILSKSGRIVGIAHVGALRGQVLAAAGQTVEALEVLGQSEAAFRRLGRTQEADEVAGRIAQLKEGRAG